MTSNYFLTVKEVARHLGVEPRYIYGKVSRETIPFKKLGKGIRFLKTDILEWIDRFDIRYHGEALTWREIPQGKK